MPLCPNSTNPVADITEGLKFFIEFGEDETLNGDFSIAGIGTRNFGGNLISLKSIPNNTDIVAGFLFYNTYVSNNQPDPPVMMTDGNGGGASLVTSALFGISGSTCWLNPGNEPTTYLRNRVYFADVTPLVSGNGNYTVTGLPVDFSMPIDGDGDRRPGCRSSQGAVLVVVWKYKGGGGPQNASQKKRGVNIYLGSKLIDPIPGFWGGTPAYTLQWEPVQSTKDMKFFKGNAKIAFAAGDTKIGVQGDQLAVNQYRIPPIRHSWAKNLGSALTIRQFSIQSVYDGKNSSFASTTNCCYNWFLQVFSGDKTEPRAQYNIINCAATSLYGRCPDKVCDSCKGEDVQPTDPNIIVYSNYVVPNQKPCRGVQFNGKLYNAPLPPDFTPGSFPNAPFFIKIDKEIMQVTKKEDCNYGEQTPTDAEGASYSNPTVWTVTRGIAGTTPATHKLGACVFLVTPPQFINTMLNGLAPRGRPPQRPNPGRPRGRRFQ